MKLSQTEAQILSDASSALYYLNEKEPSKYSQSMARQYVEDIQRALLDMQAQKEPFIPQPCNNDGSEF